MRRTADGVMLLLWVFSIAVLLRGGGGLPFLPAVEPPIAKDGLWVLVVADAQERDPNVVNSMKWRELIPAGHLLVASPGQTPSDAAFAAAMPQPYTEPVVIISKRPGGGETRALKGMTADDLAALVKKWGA